MLLIAGLDIPSVKHLKTVFRTMGLMAYPEEKLIIVMNRADSKVGLEVSEVEKHLGKKVKTAISSSVEVPRALNAGELSAADQAGSQGLPRVDRTGEPVRRAEQQWNRQVARVGDGTQLLPRTLERDRR